MQLGAKLGADVPFCILGGTALGRGIGELLEPLPPLEKIWLTLVNPGFMVSTAWVYQNLHFGSKNENLGLTKSPKNVNILIQQIQTNNLRRICGEMFNALEAVVVSKYPIIGNLKNQLKESGALGALMSGSGPTVFALMPDEPHAKAAAEKLSGETYFCTTTTMSPVGVIIN